MLPSFFYMMTASSLAVFIISISISTKLSHTLFIKQMVSTGQLSLSNYFFHVIIGMLAIKLFFRKLEFAFSIEFTILYAIVFSVVIVFFSHIWCMKFKKGSLEYIMRKITGWKPVCTTKHIRNSHKPMLKPKITKEFVCLPTLFSRPERQSLDNAKLKKNGF